MSHNAFQSSEPIEPQEASPLKHERHVPGIDIAKRVFHAVGMDDRGNVVYRKRLSRHDLMPCSAKLPPVRIGMEACGGAHYWARRFREHGHEVKLRAPQFVKPYSDPFPRSPHDNGRVAVYTCPGPRERRDPAGVIFSAPGHCTRNQEGGAYVAVCASRPLCGPQPRCDG